MNIKKFLKEEKTLFDYNSKAIIRHNRSFFVVLSKIGFFIFALLYLVSLFVSTLEVMQSIYICMTILFFVLTLMSMKNYRMNYLHALYMIYGGLIIIFTFSSAYLNPNSISIFVLILLFQFQLLVLDRWKNILMFTLLFSTFYLIITFPVKEYYVMIEEVINLVFVLFMSIPVSTYLRSMRLENYDYARVAKLNENTDELTGLNNRRKFRKDCIAEYDNNRGFVGLAILDIDNFKLYNDTYSHLAGDSCLKIVANCFMIFGAKHNIRFFRYGGEEFVALVNNDDKQNIIELFNQLNKEVSNLNIEHNKALTGHITISIGVSIIAKDQHINVNQQLEQADLALYQAKNNGRNQTVVYNGKATSNEFEAALI